VPLVYVDRATAAPPGPGETGITTAIDLSHTLDLVLTLQPTITRVFVISGASEFDRFYEDLAREQFQRFAGRVTPTYLSGLSLADLEQAVPRLPPDSVIYFLTLSQDGAGARLISPDAVERLAAMANVPTYGWNESAMNRGIVGGRLLSNAVVAARTAELALRILRGEKPETIPVVAFDPYVTQLDWRQLQRWGISEARAPRGTTILFREPGLWERYRFYIVATLALVSLETVLIAALLVQRARRRVVEAKLTASNAQIRDLFGRLIRAQETERTRIARDLHDDVSQRIAGLSIMISGLKRRQRGEEIETDVLATLTSLQQNTGALAEEIRTLSHDLHPGVLQHAGLVTALGEFCAEFERQHGITTTCRAGANLEAIDADVALCLYRIAQEALRNVVKHAGARNINVALARTAEGIQMSIADDGKGFDLLATRRKGSGLGLVSIDERVRLMRGTVDIETHQRGGTRVVVRLPLPREETLPDSVFEQSA